MEEEVVREHLVETVPLVEMVEELLSLHPTRRS
jgi:hypothetical protein